MTQPLSFTPDEIQNDKALGGVAYITVIGLIIAAIVGKERRFVMYHVQQSIVVGLVWLASLVVLTVPLIGWLVGWLLGVATLVFMILGAVNAFSGKAVPLPLIGHLGLKFNLVR